jgi:hypothetical protein
MSDDTITIDCDTCVMRRTDACNDCVVTFLESIEPRTAVVVDVGELRALRLLADQGLVPRLRHRRAG